MPSIKAHGKVKRIVTDNSFLLELASVNGKPWSLPVFLKEGLKLPKVGVYIDITGELVYKDMSGYNILVKELKQSELQWRL